MTRFQMELSGKLGQFWQNEAQKELERVKSDLDSCKIVIDGDGVAVTASAVRWPTICSKRSSWSLLTA